MADFGDQGAAAEEFNRQRALGQRPGHLEGPARCLRCGESNDRAKAGYAACSDCVEGA